MYINIDQYLPEENKFIVFINFADVTYGIIPLPTRVLLLLLLLAIAISEKESDIKIIYVTNLRPTPTLPAPIHFDNIFLLKSSKPLLLVLRILLLLFLQVSLTVSLRCKENMEKQADW